MSKKEILLTAAITLLAIALANEPNGHRGTRSQTPDPNPQPEDSPETMTFLQYVKTGIWDSQVQNIPRRWRVIKHHLLMAGTVAGFVPYFCFLFYVMAAPMVEPFEQAHPGKMTLYQAMEFTMPYSAIAATIISYFLVFFCDTGARAWGPLPPGVPSPGRSRR